MMKLPHLPATHGIPGPRARSGLRHARQQGFGLLEAIAAIAVLAFVAIMASTYAAQATEDQRVAVTAQHMVAVANAARAYAAGNYAALQAAATPTTPAIITVPMLISTGYLPTGFLATNNRGSTVCVHVLEPVANQLNALAVAVGGTSVDDMTLGQTALLMGAAGGGVYAATPTQLTGAQGGWAVAVTNYAKDCSGAATVLTGRPAYALWFGADDLATSTLYRDAVPGRPDLNQMNVPMVMASVQTTGAICAAGAIARDAAGKVLSCQSGVFAEQGGGSAYWGDPVAAFANLPACNAAALGQTRVVRAPAVGTGPRAHTCDGTSWRALAVDNNGNLVMPGTLTAGTVQLADMATEGSACSQDGRLSRDTVGMSLSCQSGVWRKQDFCRAWTGDLNGLSTSGCYNGDNLGNAPTVDWFFVEVMRHTNTTNYYAIQRATGMTGSAANRTWTRSQQSGTAGAGWSAWKEAGGGGMTTRVISGAASAWRWPTASIFCLGSEVVVGGGGSCGGPYGDTRVINVRPNGNGWYVACDTAANQTVTATVYAICATP